MLLQQIESFLAVADAANFTHAARDTHVSQPTLSRHVSTLEDELGFELFRRGKRPLRLTAPGRVFYDGAKRALAQLDYAAQMARAAAEGRSGSLSVGFYSGMYLEYLYLPTLAELREACRQLCVTCDKLNNDGIVRGLRDESIDVAIGLDYPQFSEAGLETVNLAKIPAVFAMSAQHRLAAKNVLEHDDLDGETLYLPAPMASFGAEGWMGPLFNLERIAFVEVASVEVAYMKLISEGGLTISNALDPVLKGNPLYHRIELADPDLFPHACAVYNPDNQNAAKDLFVELLKHADVAL